MWPDPKKKELTGAAVDSPCLQKHLSHNQLLIASGRVPQPSSQALRLTNIYLLPEACDRFYRCLGNICQLPQPRQITLDLWTPTSEVGCEEDRFTLRVSKVSEELKLRVEPHCLWRSLVGQ